MFSSRKSSAPCSWPWCAVLVIAAAAIGACGGTSKAPADKASGASATPAPAKPADDAGELPPPPYETSLPEDVRNAIGKPFTGDFDDMVKRRLVRLGVAFNRTFYFVDKGVQRGIMYDYGQLMEENLNAKIKTGNLKIHVVFVPLPRDLLIPALVQGKVDLVAAQVTVMPELQQQLDFSVPTRKNVDEIVVTGPSAPAIASIGDLSGKEVFVRRASPYHASLVALNAKLKAQGKPPVEIRDAPENLEDDDLLEMVNAGLIPAVVVDNYLAEFWKKVFPNLTVHGDIAVRTGGELAVAMRKSSPQLAAALNQFVSKYGLGTSFGNQMEQRYLVSTRYAKNATSDAERQKFLALVELFRKYSDQYNVDFLLMAAQGFQESGLNQDAKSPVGAIGIMQVMPATGAELKVGDITVLEPNVHAGVKYMRFMIDQYFKDEPMDGLNKALFAFASYNAGPGRVRQLRREAEKRGLDPNVWFGNVEQVASERIGRETVTYVANIYKYYVAYRLVLEQKQRRDAAVAGVKKAGAK
jgi:membrane-bound lytic murein transglycosylase MltF